jgi:hypothetical protein
MARNERRLGMMLFSLRRKTISLALSLNEANRAL